MCPSSIATCFLAPLLCETRLLRSLFCVQSATCRAGHIESRTVARPYGKEVYYYIRAWNRNTAVQYSTSRREEGANRARVNSLCGIFFVLAILDHSFFRFPPRPRRLRFVCCCMFLVEKGCTVLWTVPLKFCCQFITACC